MFSVSHLYFISHRWVHFFCTHLSVTFLYMCLLKSLFFYCHGDWLSISLCSRLLWSIPDNVICWVPDIDLRLSRRFTLVCSWFISFFFISSDKYICWQEVTIKPSWNFTSLNSFFTDVCYNEFPDTCANLPHPGKFNVLNSHCKIT